MKEGARDRGLFGAAAICLVLIFVWRLLPAHESPSPTLNTLSLVLELALVIGLVGLAPRVLRSLPAGSARGGWTFLLVVALASALGIFGIRLSGGPRIIAAKRAHFADLELPVRTSTESLEAAEMRVRLSSFIGSAGTSGDRFANSRWIEVLASRDPAQVRTLTRREVQEARASCRELEEWTEKILKVFDEAESKRIDVSDASLVPAANRRETWLVGREEFGAAGDYMDVVDQHWDEWRANPFPADGTDLKPWQEELQGSMGVWVVRLKQFHALLKPKVK